MEVLGESASKVKLAEAKKVILEVMGILDKTGLNRKKYEELFGSMDDRKLEKFLRSVVDDPDEYFVLEVVPWKNEPSLRDIKRAAGVLGVPLEEYVYLRHIVDGREVRTKTPVPVGLTATAQLKSL